MKKIISLLFIVLICSFTISSQEIVSGVKFKHFYLQKSYTTDYGEASLLFTNNDKIIISAKDIRLEFSVLEMDKTSTSDFRGVLKNSSGRIGTFGNSGDSFIITIDNTKYTLTTVVQRLK